jgi:hypothetical protein
MVGLQINRSYIVLAWESRGLIFGELTQAYRPQPFTSEAMRMEFLFELYEKYTAGLFAEPVAKKKNKTK